MNDSDFFMRHPFLNLFLAILYAFSSPAFASSQPERRLRPLEVITRIPQSGLDTVRSSFDKDSVGPWLAISASTLGLYVYDREILDDVQRWGREQGIGNSDKTRAILEVGDIPLFRAPTDTGSTLYFLGDGWTHFAIAGGFTLFGLDHEKPRAWNTGLQIVHGMVVSTFFSQAIKRATGRESPSDATSFRGTWRPFPNPKHYGERTARYDAFPSGHIMTATLTFSVIAINYPEYAGITIPVGALWVTALGLQMINNGVHWASDYPLGIAIGYAVAKTVTAMDRAPSGESVKPRSYFVYPGQFAGTGTINLLKLF